jgi:hypothetical protein
MHRHFRRRFGRPKTFYNWSRSSLQSSALWSVASGLYGRIHSLPRYARKKPTTSVSISSHNLLGCFRLYRNTQSAFGPRE